MASTAPYRLLMRGVNFDSGTQLCTPQKGNCAGTLYLNRGHHRKKYFTMLKAPNRGFEMQVFASKRTNPVGIVESCMGRMSLTNDPADRGIAVFDIDNNTDEELAEAFKLAAENGIYAAISNPFFETWLLMHFQSIPNEFGKEDIDRKLKEHMPAYSKTAELTELKMRIADAIQRGYSGYGEWGCETVLSNCPSTNMHCAVKRIIDGKMNMDQNCS